MDNYITILKPIIVSKTEMEVWSNIVIILAMTQTKVSVFLFKYTLAIQQAFLFFMEGWRIPKSRLNSAHMGCDLPTRRV